MNVAAVLLGSAALVAVAATPTVMRDDGSRVAPCYGKSRTVVFVNTLGETHVVDTTMRDSQFTMLTPDANYYTQDRRFHQRRGSLDYACAPDTKLLRENTVLDPTCYGRSRRIFVVTREGAHRLLDTTLAGAWFSIQADVSYYDSHGDFVQRKGNLAYVCTP